MLLGFSYLYNFVMFCFFFFFQKTENDRLKNDIWPKFCNIIFLILLKIGSVRPVDQQINLVLPYKKMKKKLFSSYASKII